MKRRIPLVPVSRLALYCAVETVAALVLLGAIVWAVPYLRQSRDQLHELTRQLAAVPDSTSQQSVLETSLKTHAHDIARIRAYIPHQDALTDIIEVLEERAAAHQVEVRIPVIDVVQASSEEAQPSPDPYQNVRLDMLAVGSPEALLRFFHDVEHLPYVLSVVEWEVGPASAAGLAALRARALPTPAGEGAVARPPSGQLNATLLLKVVPAL